MLHQVFDFVRHLFDIFMHLDKHLGALIQTYGSITYAVLFVTVFAETGLVVTPLLPGDSLLFAAGTFAARGDLHITWLIGILVVAAVAGDTVNYWVGYGLGPKVFQNENSKIFKKEYLKRTHQFYEKYGKKTIVLARFVPIVRTFAPFVAGVGKMRYVEFMSYNIVGGVAWVLVCTLAGYFFGNIEVVKKNFELAILAIIFISVLPVAIEFWRHHRASTPTSG